MSTWRPAAPPDLPSAMTLVLIRLSGDAWEFPVQTAFLKPWSKTEWRWITAKSVYRADQISEWAEIPTERQPTPSEKVAADIIQSASRYMYHQGATAEEIKQVANILGGLDPVGPDPLF